MQVTSESAGARARGRLIRLELDDPRWAAFVAGRPDALPFHHPAWPRLLAECYRYPAAVLAVVDGAGHVAAGVPTLAVNLPFQPPRLVALPFTDYCPVLGEPDAARALVAALVAGIEAGALGSFELRAGLLEDVHVYPREVAVRHTQPLASDPADVFQQFSKMHRRNVRKAEQSGVRVRLGRELADVRRFYRLHLLTRYRLGVPIQPRGFFDALAQRLIEPGYGFVLTAYLERRPIAAAVFLAWNGMLIYKYGASDQAYWQQRPNNLLFWEAIRWGCRHGFQTFDWGRTDFEDEGLRQFKSAWGAREEPLAYTTIARRPPAAPSGRLNRALARIIHRSPPWVCRAIGELAYRYAT